MKKSTRILLIGGIVGATTLVAKIIEQKNKSIDRLIEMNNQKVDIIRNLNEMLDFSEEAIEKSQRLWEWIFHFYFCLYKVLLMRIAKNQLL